VKYKRNPNNIPGIHNYCDRWCERCYFSSRCAVYENTSDLTPEENDINNKAFWNRISENFANASIIIKEAAKKHGIDLDNIPEEETSEYKRKEEDLEQQIKKHPLSKLSLSYINEGKKLLDTDELLKEKRDELVAQAEMGIQSEEQIINEAATIKDCVEVVQWYLFFIHVKFDRALHGKLEGEEFAEEHGFPKDSDGSAKIALIATDRSIEAWIKLLQLLPDHEDSIIPLLASLQKIKKSGEAEFPDAGNFVRPGFDEQVK